MRLPSASSYFGPQQASEVLDAVPVLKVISFSAKRLAGSSGLAPPAGTSALTIACLGPKAAYGVKNDISESSHAVSGLRRS